MVMKDDTPSTPPSPPPTPPSNKKRIIDTNRRFPVRISGTGCLVPMDFSRTPSSPCPAGKLADSLFHPRLAGARHRGGLQQDIPACRRCATNRPEYWRCATNRPKYYWRCTTNRPEYRRCATNKPEYRRCATKRPEYRRCATNRPKYRRCAT